MIIQSLTEGIMSHFFRRFLPTVMLSAMLACTAFSPLSTAVVYANAESVKAAAFRGTEAEPLVDPDDESASSVRDEKDGAGINTDVIQEDQLIYSHGKYRYRLSNGKYLKRSWKTIGNKTYYFNKKGYALKGLQKIGNYYYIFSSKGVLKKGWIKYKKHYYYGSVNKRGRLLTGWQKIGGKRYYISVKKLYRLTGFQYIGHKIYYFNSKGVQQRTDQIKHGKKLVFNYDGSVYSYGSKVYGQYRSSSSSYAKGQQLVNYAVQFVGNPYKWGGSSLTHGCDCSGFVMAVYARFGISLPHYDAWIRQRGRAVNGLANAQPGDVICYDGHVAIYMGGGRIVHAADYKYGICIWNNAAFRRILSIRRFF